MRGGAAVAGAELADEATISHGRLHDGDSPARGLALGTRWLGVGLGSIIAVITLSLALTGQIGLYINPEASWWAISMSIVLLIGAVATCAVPITGHAHGHTHGDDAHTHRDAPGHPAHDHTDHAHPAHDRAATHDHSHDLPPRAPIAVTLTVAGGVIASGFVVAALALPPAALSTELALSRATGVPVQLASSSTLTLATSGDTSSFGVGEWSAVLATSTDPSAYAGDTATLTGFTGPGLDDDQLALTRLVIVHCVIDAQAASIPVAAPEWQSDIGVGEWVEIVGTFVQDDSGSLVLEPTSLSPIAAPADPYEY